jgi:hypothetical protein
MMIVWFAMTIVCCDKGKINLQKAHINLQKAYHTCGNKISRYCMVSATNSLVISGYYIIITRHQDVITRYYNQITTNYLLITFCQPIFK